MQMINMKTSGCVVHLVANMGLTCIKFMTYFNIRYIIQSGVPTRGRECEITQNIRIKIGERYIEGQNSNT